MSKQQAIPYYSRFYWESYLVMNTICLDNEEIRSRTSKLFEQIQEIPDINQRIGKDFIDKVQKKFEDKKFNNIYHILDELLERLIAKNNALGTLTSDEIVASNEFQILKAKVIELFGDLCIETIELSKVKANKNEDFLCNLDSSRFELESALISQQINPCVLNEIFLEFKQQFPECFSNQNPLRFEFDFESLTRPQLAKALKIINNLTI